MPAGNSITVSANSPIGESGLVVNNTTLAPIDCAFSANKRKCSVEPEPDKITNKSCSLIEGVVDSPTTNLLYQVD